MNFKFIYFDVGGVVIKDFSKSNKWQELKQALGITETLSSQFDELFSKYETEFCKGQDVETILPIIQSQLGVKPPQKLILLDQFVKRFEKNPSILPVLKKAKKISNGVGLLTNMYPKMFEKIRQAQLFPEFIFDVVIDSSIEKTLKPEKQIFKIAQQKSGFQPNEILFIDNSQAHLTAAEKLGWNIYLYDPADYERSSAELMNYFDQKIKK